MMAMSSCMNSVKHTDCLAVHKGFCGEERGRSKRAGPPPGANLGCS